MSLNSCSACSPELIDRRIILASLRKQLLKLNLDYQPDYGEQNDTQVLNDMAFNRLIQIIFKDDSTFLHSNNKCLHHRLLRYLRRKLKCNSQILNDLCNQLILTMAQRNYQLNVLTMQIKSAQITIERIVQDTNNSEMVKLQVKRLEEQIYFDTRQSLALQGYKQNNNEIQQKEQAQQFRAGQVHNYQEPIQPTHKLQSN